MSKKVCVLVATLVACCAITTGCKDVPWPASPLYAPFEDDPEWVAPVDRADALAAVAGHYAHYDIVAYEMPMYGAQMRTFIISYGFTDFIADGDALIEFDEFCHAEHLANQNMTSSFSDAATQAILPRTAEVELFQEDGAWKIWRPQTPTLIGIDGDPDQPLSMDPDDPNINDADGDGKPGVTVSVKIGGFLDAEIYIARREIFQSDLTLHSNGSLRGRVVDDSEQLVIGATHSFLAAENNPPQADDPGLSPIILVPVNDDLDTCAELMANRDALFPPEPSF